MPFFDGVHRRITHPFAESRFPYESHTTLKLTMHGSVATECFSSALVKIAPLPTPFCSESTSACGGNPPFSAMRSSSDAASAVAVVLTATKMTSHPLSAFGSSVTVRDVG